MRKHSLSSLCKKVLFLTACLCTVLLVSCQDMMSGLNGGDEENIETGATISVQSFPEGVYCVAFYNPDYNPVATEGYSTISYWIHKEDLPFNKTFSSRDGMDFPKKGMQLKIIIGFEEGYGTLQGEKPLKVLQNGTELEEIKGEYKTDAEHLVTNLAQYRNGYTALITLADNNVFTFSAGDLRKLKATDIKLANNTQYTYVDLSGIPGYAFVEYDNAGNPQYLNYQCAVNGLYYCPPGREYTVYINASYGNKLKMDGFKVNDQTSGELKLSSRGSYFEGKFTSGEVDTVSVVTVEEEPISDLWSAAGQNLASEFKIKYNEFTGEPVKEPAAGELSIKFDDSFTAGGGNKAVLNGKPATWYYITNDNINYEIHVEYDDLSNNGSYTVEKNGDQWIISSANARYYTGKTIIVQDFEDTPAGWEEMVYLSPEFNGFTAADLDANKNPKLYVDGVYKEDLKNTANSYGSNVYYFQPLQSWEIDPRKSHTYSVEFFLKDGAAIKSNEAVFSMRTILLTVPEGMDTVVIGERLELPVEIINYGLYSVPETPGIFLSSDSFKPDYTVQPTTYPVIRAEITDNKLIIPTCFLKPEEIEMYITYSEYTTEKLSNTVTLTFTQPESIISISDMQAGEDNVVINGEDAENLIPISFSNGFEPENVYVRCYLRDHEYPDSEPVELEAPVVDGKIKFTFYSHSLNEYVNSWDMTVTTCNLEESNSIVIKAKYRDEGTITITDTSDINAVIGDVIKIPVRVDGSLEVNNYSKLYTYYYTSAAEEEPQGYADWNLSNFEYHESYRTAVVEIPTYSADEAIPDFYFSVASRGLQDEKHIGVESSEKVKISLSERNEEGDGIGLKVIDYSGDGSEAETINTMPGSMLAFKITPEFAEPVPEKAAYMLYVKGTYDGAVVHRFSNEFSLNEYNDLLSFYSQTSYGSSYDGYFYGASGETLFKFEEGKTYEFWVVSCGVKSNIVTVNMQDPNANMPDPFMDGM